MHTFPCESRESLRPLHVAGIALVVLTVGGGLLLLSAAEPTAPVDGAIEWREDSPLRAVVQLLCLNYQLATPNAGAVKDYVLGIGTALAVMCFALATLSTPRPGENHSDDGGPEKPPRDAGDADGGSDDSSAGGVGESAPVPDLVVNPRREGQTHKPHIAPLIAAQALVALYLLWSFASARWSAAPDLSLGGSVLLAVQFVWALALGNLLNPRAARYASRVVMILSVVTAVVAIWYHYGRNPTLRADFPVGNPNFLAACLIPGILLAIASVGELFDRMRYDATASNVGLVFAAVAAGAILVWAFLIADSRGPMIGLMFGVLAMAFFGAKGRMKLGPATLAVIAIIGGLMYMTRAAGAFSPTARDATLRLRGYAWSYAWRMFVERPFRGFGQGGFALAGDSYAVHDVLSDPIVFENRIAHAHNEWLEIMADLGSVGIVLVAVALVLTLRAAVSSRELMSPTRDRWVVLALIGALVGLTVESAFGVGLRTSGVPILFFTVIGLSWAMSRHQTRGLTDVLSARRGRRMATGVIAGLVGVGAAILSQQNFLVARDAQRAGEALANGKEEDAIRLASAATFQLHPQRALINRFRLGEAHLYAAEMFQRRAHDRENRSHESDPPNERLVALAARDYQQSDEQCDEGSAALKELVVRSPGFINHGWLGYWLNLTRARNAAARNDPDKQQALLQSAAAAMQRELQRQPFHPSYTVDYLRVAGPTLSLPEVIETAARPLRHHAFAEVDVSEHYVPFLQQLSQAPDFDETFAAVLDATFQELNEPALNERTGQPVETWVPEKLRLAAAILSLRGDYDGARRLLKMTTPVYERIRERAPLGAAGSYDEFALAQFLSMPEDPAAAWQLAERAIALAPGSRAGRAVARAVKQRIVGYYLAADQEQEAARLLRELAGSAATADDIARELAFRYRRLCELLLERREAGGLLRKPPENVAERMQRWVHRAIELNPADAYSHFLAADIAFYLGDDVATVVHLQDALRAGFDAALVRTFVDTARDVRPDSREIQALWEQLVKEAAPNPGNADAAVPTSPRKVASPRPSP